MKKQELTVERVPAPASGRVCCSHCYSPAVVSLGDNHRAVGRDAWIRSVVSWLCAFHASELRRELRAAEEDR